MLKKILSYPFIFLIYVYRYTISPLTPASCRHIPTCSEYSIEAFKKHGLIKGMILSFRRVIRCHPWGTSGYDPVPDEYKIEIWKKEQ